MLDDLREQADNADFLENEDAFFETTFEEPPTQSLILGMTPVQRFVIAVMILMMVCIMSTFCLLVGEKIALPFL